MSEKKQTKPLYTCGKTRKAGKTVIKWIFGALIVLCPLYS